MGFDVFDDLVAQEFLDPENRRRHAQKLTKAYVDVDGRLGAFLRNAKTKDDLESRLALVSRDILSVCSTHDLDEDDQGKIVARLKQSAEDDDLDKSFTTAPQVNPGAQVPWEKAGPVDQQDAPDNSKNDATLEHISKKNKIADQVQGVNRGDRVEVTQTTADAYSGQDIREGSVWSVEGIYGSEAELYSPNGIDSGDGMVQSYVSVPIQVLQRIGQHKVAQWVWDPESNSYKSSNTSTFACECGRKLSGVGQHKCQCGKVWNMASILNGSKTATDAPTYSVREVKTDPRFVLADAKNNGTGNDPAKGGSGDSIDDPVQDDLIPGEGNPSLPGNPRYPDTGTEKASKLARRLRADAGLWPLVGDKDLQANWKTLMGIITDPTQVNVLQHQGYQGLIQELYDEINRRGLATPVDPYQVDQSGQPQPGQPSMQQPDLVSPGQQIPSPSALACRRMGYNAAMAGVSPSPDEPLDCLIGYVLGLNSTLAVEDPYANRSTVYDGSEPPIEGVPNARDDLTAEGTPDDPTAGQRADFARDTDLRNNEGQQDEDFANHPLDFVPDGQRYLN